MITVETGHVTTIWKKLRTTEICFLIYESSTDIIKLLRLQVTNKHVLLAEKQKKKLMLRINAPGRWKLLRFRALYLGTGHYLPGGEGYYFFEKWLEKNMTLPLQHDKKNYDLPRRRVKKIVTLPLSLFFIFILFSLTKTIFFTRRCAPSSNYFASSGKVEKQYFFTLKQRRLTIHSHSFCMCLMIFFGQFFQVKAPHDQ